MKQCFFCETKFAYENHQYDGKYVGIYRIYVCSTCHSGLWDGIALPLYVEKLFKHLDAEGIPRPEPNENGYIPMP